MYVCMYEVEYCAGERKVTHVLPLRSNAICCVFRLSLIP